MYMFVYAIVMMVISYTISSLMAPKPTKPSPQSLEDGDIPRMEEGTAQTVIFGDVWISDWYILWWGNQRSREIKSKSGGK